MVSGAAIIGGKGSGSPVETAGVREVSLELDVEKWAVEQFDSCELGDARRTARAVKMAAQFAANPSGSTPEQTETWADCKAAYRLFDADDVTFAALATPHFEQTKYTRL